MYTEKELDKAEAYAEALATVEEMIDECGVNYVVGCLSRSAGVQLMLALEKRYFDE